ncbi:MAG: hypothetical protein KF730_08135 [Sphingomonas sp.]|uniref:hypothetical protein n=1 Tax=Sphingomonas sp. TaxID=28214 RepID=UPI0025F4D5BD|nr:hypothetical protein [Sphingomonas sp.]MBX3564529.1 hypothetical protein [Sphingomonas sp.]
MAQTSHTEPESEPGIATAEGGIVMLDGPNGVAVSMTAEAAEQTGRSLIAAAEHAFTQKTS